jgi:hypothetical protein
LISPPTLDPGHIAQSDCRAVGIRAQNDGAELIRRRELPLDQNHRRYFLTK